MHILTGKDFGTVLINVGRSNIIKEGELIEALEKNWIREAIIDVFDQGSIINSILTLTVYIFNYILFLFLIYLFIFISNYILITTKRASTS